MNRTVCTSFFKFLQVRHNQIWPVWSAFAAPYGSPLWSPPQSLGGSLWLRQLSASYSELSGRPLNTPVWPNSSDSLILGRLLRGLACRYQPYAGRQNPPTVAQCTPLMRSYVDCPLALPTAETWKLNVVRSRGHSTGAYTPVFAFSILVRPKWSFENAFAARKLRSDGLVMRHSSFIDT